MDMILDAQNSLVDRYNTSLYLYIKSRYEDDSGYTNTLVFMYNTQTRI